MAAIYSDNINFVGNKPNFERDRVKTLAQLLAEEPAKRRYPFGHIVFCKEDNNHYKFNYNYENPASTTRNDVTGWFEKVVALSMSQTTGDNTGAVMSQAAISAELEKKVEAKDTALEVDSIEETLVTNALRKTAQILTDAEKQQVQKNIGVDVIQQQVQGNISTVQQAQSQSATSLRMAITDEASRATAAEKALGNRIDNIKPIEFSGTVVNSPDEEDITEVDNALKLKDRPWGDGMGYVILRKSKPLQEQLINENTIYEVRYDFDLNGEEISVPVNCVLRFKGGSLNNGTLINKVEVNSSTNAIFNNIILSVSNSTIDATWWKFSENEYENSISLQCILDTAYNSGGAVVRFDNNIIRYSETVFIKTLSSNSYTGNLIIIRGSNNDRTTPTLYYTGTGNAISLERAANSAEGKGNVVNIENICIKGDTASCIFNVDTASSLVFRRVAFHAPKGTCLYGNDIWVWRMEDSFLTGKRGIEVHSGTSAYLSNVMFESEEKALYLSGGYMRIDNIFGDFNNDVFCHFNYCNAAISSIASESGQLNEFIRAENSQLVIQNIFIHKSEKEEHSVFSGTNSSIQVQNISIPDVSSSKTPRGYINAGTYALRVVIDRLYTTGSFKDNRDSLDVTCGTTVKYYARENFAWQLPDLRGSTWFRNLDGTSIQGGDCVDSYLERPLYPKTRIIVGMQDRVTATENVYDKNGNIASVGADKQWFENLQTDDVFVNSKASAGYPYFAWVVNAKKTNFRDSDFKFVPFLTSVDNVDDTNTNQYLVGHTVYDKTRETPYWVNNNNEISQPFVVSRKLLPWYNNHSSNVHYFIIGKAGADTFNASARHLFGTLVMYYGGESDAQIYHSMFIEVNSSRYNNSAVLKDLVKINTEWTKSDFSICKIRKDEEYYLAIKYSNTSQTLDSVLFTGFHMGYEGLFTDIYKSEDIASIEEIETLAVSNTTGTTEERNATMRTGDIFFDTTLNKPIWRIGEKWVDATGTEV